jgi:hypothetical protein
MAWSSAELSAQELADLAADKPMLGEIRSQAPAAVTGARWVASATGIYTDADISDTTGVAARAYDGHPDMQTYPNAADTDCGLIFYFGAAGIGFDAIAIINHDLYTDTCNPMTVTIADDAAFTVGATTQQIASVNVGTYLSSNRRFSVLSLYHTGATARRYSGVPYVRLGFTYGGAQTPAIGEVLFLRRQQLSYAPMRPYDKERRRSVSVEHVADSGKVHSYVLRRGQRVVRYEFANVASEAQKLIDLWDNSNQGMARVALINAPYSAPNDVLMLKRMGEEIELEAPYIGPLEQSFSFEAEEVGPNFLEVYP